LYKYAFDVPATWKNKKIQIVFEGSMTDTDVKINGRSAGEQHQGSFYAFKYDITELLQFGEKNMLEVTVAKHSANASVNEAERKADFWIFGGIFRPVFLEVLPPQHIDHIAIDAKASGVFKASVSLKNIATANSVSIQLYSLDGKKSRCRFYCSY
jgi:beta-galactosidase/beta-glucuronidase